MQQPLKNCNFYIPNQYTVSRSILLFLLLFCSTLSFGQQRKFAHIGLPEGLPQETVHAMATDTLGMVWLGTSDGLVRYDGSQFHLPLADTKTQLDIAGYRIGAVASYRDYILAGTGQKGLMAYHVIDQTTQSLGSNNSNCTTILPLKDGFLAGYFDGSISYFDNNLTETRLRFSSEKYNRINAIAVYNQQLYIGTDDGKLLTGLYTEGTTDIELVRLHLPTSSINFLKAYNSTLFIGTAENLFQLKDQQEQPQVVVIPWCQPQASMNVTDVVFTKNRTFLATTTGLFEWIKNDCATQYISADKNNPFYLNANAINDLHLVNETLLIGHITLDITAVNPPTVFELPSTHWNLSNPSVFAVHRTENYLIAGTSSGLVIADAKQPEHYRIFPEFRLRGITEDTQNNIWLVSGNGAYVVASNELGLDQPNFKSIPVSEENTTGLTSNNLRNVFTDNKGNVWITTFSKGLCKFEGNLSVNDYRFKQYAYGKQAEQLPSPLTLSMVQDNNDAYWIATQKGLSKMTLDASGTACFTSYSETQGLVTNGVLSSYIAEDGTLWVGSRKGLNKYVAEENRFVSFGKRDGLTNTFVYNILEDAKKHLWVTTNGGLFKFNPETEQFANYLPKDGVQSTEFNLGALSKDKNSGLLYAGGIAGLTVFDPNRVDELDAPAPLLFSNITSKGQTLHGAFKKSTLSNKITFQYNDFPISLSYAALDYRPSKNNNYEYRLLPQDKQWNKVTNNQDIQLLNLSSGSYTLELRGLSRGIPWKQKPLELALTITPPWYRSTLAFICYVLLIGGAIFMYYQSTLQRKLAGEETRRLQDLDDLKTRFITNITHEFRTPLTIILGYIDTLKEKIASKPEQSDDLRIIENNSTNLLHLVNQMLDLAKLEKGKLHVDYQKQDVVTFTNGIVSTFEHTAKEKEIQLTASDSFTDPIIDFDAEKLRQILSNLISNALKFTDRGSVAVTLSETEKEYSISVKDTGRGIPEKDLPNIFERFYQIENNDFKVSQGTGIGLALTKELVHLMNGTIQVTSQPNIGTTFTITLPLKRVAPTAQYTNNSAAITTGIEVPSYQHTLPAKDDQLVLVVEDNPDMSRYIGSCLQPYFNVLFAFNGQEGLAKATEHTPDIIVSDVMMPILDGFQMTQQLQEQETTNHIPVILLTSKAAQEDTLEGLESGADAYLTKPFQKQELLVRITKLIEKRTLLQQKYSVDTLIAPQNNSKAPTDKNDVFLQKVITHIEDDLGNHEFGSAQLASALALSESQLYRKLKAITDTSTAIFIRSVRLEKAKILLQTSTKNVSEIAYETGFNDPNWFGKVFKEKFGVPPSEIQKT